MAKLIEEKGWQLDTNLVLHDTAVSAWKGNNAAVGVLSEFLKLCRNKTVKKGSVLVIEHLDRLSRDFVRQALGIFMEILNAGVSIQTIEPMREYRPEDNDPLPLIEALLLFAQAQ